MTVDAIATTTMELPATTLLVTVNHGGWAHCGEMSRLSEQPFPVQVSSARPLPREFCSPCRSDLIRSTCTSEGLPTLTVFRTLLLPRCQLTASSPLPSSSHGWRWRCLAFRQNSSSLSGTANLWAGGLLSVTIYPSVRLLDVTEVTASSCRVDAEDTLDESLRTLADAGVLHWTANFPGA